MSDSFIRTDCDRRHFLRIATLTACGIPLSTLTRSLPRLWAEEAEDLLKIKEYRTLGRTGLKVSDIGLGAGGTTDPAVIQYALDCGITYFDTAENYARGKSEETIGKVTAKNRDKMVICTKLGLDGSTKIDDMVTRMEASLKRMQTEYCDILMIHGGDPGALKNDEVYKGFEKLKKDGKIKFSGVSHHGPNIAESLKSVVEENRLDVMLLGYDPESEKDLPEFLKRADEKGIGLVAMKVLRGAKNVKIEEFETKQLPFQQAALTWALRDPYMDCILASMNIMDQVDAFLPASGRGKKK